MEKGRGELEGGRWKGKLKWKENVAKCAGSSSRQRGGGGVGESKKSQVKSSIFCVPSPVFLGAGRSQPLTDLFQREGVWAGKESACISFP